LQKNHFLDFKKLGLDFRIVDVFADIQEDNLNDCIKKLYSTFCAKNIIKVMSQRRGGWNLYKGLISRFKRLVLFDGQNKNFSFCFKCTLFRGSRGIRR
jgi:hypothetical protein